MRYRIKIRGNDVTLSSFSNKKGDKVVLGQVSYKLDESLKDKTKLAAKIDEVNRKAAVKVVSELQKQPHASIYREVLSNGGAK